MSHLFYILFSRMPPHQHFCRETHNPHLIYTYSKIFSLSRNLIFLQEKNSAFALLLIPVYIPCTFKTTYSQNQHHHPNLSLLWLCPRPISNSQLHVLPHFHLCPIYLVVFKGVYFLKNGISHLEGGFTLRCLQRLSLPDLATRP